ncbi:MAG TPA: hypothetical protein VG476_03350 [Acidimicrobiales bacterium]|nr:hypothetical protein [Acidimicrobiales bacterium]
MTHRRSFASAVIVTAVASLALAACSSGADVSGTPSQRVQGWSHGVGFDASSTKIAAELNQVTKTAQAGDLGGLQAVSVQLQDDATIAHAQLPTPDQQLTDQLDSAYQNAYQLANRYLDKGLGADRAAGLAAIEHQAETAQQALRSAQARAAALVRS